MHKYRLVVLNEATFEERFSFKLNRLNVFVFGTLFAVALIALTIMLIAFTPLREYIPGYSSTSLKKKAVVLTYKTDSLERALRINQEYIRSLRQVLTGDIKTTDFNKDSILDAVRQELDSVQLLPSAQDSALREIVAQEDRYNPLIEEEPVTLVLFPPVKGPISQGYDSENQHFAVDVVTAMNSPVKATADGTVIFAGWTPDTGHVIILEHPNDLISVYKHNASINKEQGDLVKSGEVIAAAGDSGELSTGPHLHFELWSGGYPINPENFIDFE